MPRALRSGLATPLPVAHRYNPIGEGTARMRARWMSPALLTAATALTFVPVSVALAWGDEGHQVIALIAAHYFTPAAKAKVNALLTANASNTLTTHDIASEATGADKYRQHGGSAKTGKVETAASEGPPQTWIGLRRVPQSKCA